MELTEQQSIRVIGKAMVVVDITRLCVLVFDETIGRVIAGVFNAGELWCRIESKWQARREVTEYRVEMEAFRKQCEAYDRMQARSQCKAHHPAGKGLWRDPELPRTIEELRAENERNGRS